MLFQLSSDVSCSSTKSCLEAAGSCVEPSGATGRRVELRVRQPFESLAGRDDVKRRVPEGQQCWIVLCLEEWDEGVRTLKGVERLLGLQVIFVKQRSWGKGQQTPLRRKYRRHTSCESNKEMKEERRQVK